MYLFMYINVLKRVKIIIKYEKIIFSFKNYDLFLTNVFIKMYVY